MNYKGFNARRRIGRQDAGGPRWEGFFWGLFKAKLIILNIAHVVGFEGSPEQVRRAFGPAWMLWVNSILDLNRVKLLRNRKLFQLFFPDA